MVLNGKAELARNAAQTAKIRNDSGELFGMIGMVTAGLILSWQLYSNMVDGWQRHTQARWHVLTLASCLLTLSIVTCVYLCRRLSHPQANTMAQSTLVSVNSQIQLLRDCRNLPPSYEAVGAPPPYSAVFIV